MSLDLNKNENLGQEMFPVLNACKSIKEISSVEAGFGTSYILLFPLKFKGTVDLRGQTHIQM